jgi:hypothetical protein
LQGMTDSSSCAIPPSSVHRWFMASMKMTQQPWGRCEWRARGRTAPVLCKYLGSS